MRVTLHEDDGTVIETIQLSGAFSDVELIRAIEDVAIQYAELDDDGTVVYVD